MEKQRRRLPWVLVALGAAMALLALFMLLETRDVLQYCVLAPEAGETGENITALAASAKKLGADMKDSLTWAALDACLPEFVTGSMREALPLLDRRLKGFARPDAVLTGVETRSSSPVRIERDGDCLSNLRGLYPCGEGAGYAGGIMSAAVDGIRCAEALCERLRRESENTADPVK